MDILEGKLTQLESLKEQLDTLTHELESLADSNGVRMEAFSQYNNLVVYLQEARRSLRLALKTAREI